MREPCQGGGFGILTTFLQDHPHHHSYQSYKSSQDHQSYHQGTLSCGGGGFAGHVSSTAVLQTFTMDNDDDHDHDHDDYDDHHSGCYYGNCFRND